MMIDTVSLNLKKALIRKQTCFALLTDHEVEVLATLLREKHISAGEVIVNEGEPVDCFYLIVSGDAEVRHISLKQPFPQVEYVAHLSANNWDAIGLNETGFYSLSGLRTATVVALTDMILLGLSLSIFHGFALSYSHVNEVMRQQSERFVVTK